LRGGEPPLLPPLLRRPLPSLAGAVASASAMTTMIMMATKMANSLTSPNRTPSLSFHFRILKLIFTFPQEKAKNRARSSKR